VKRSILTDSRGIPIGIIIAPANWHDSTILVQTIRSIPIHRPRPTRRKPQHICLDKGYDAEWIQVVLSVLGFIPHIARREFTNRNLRSHHSKKKAKTLGGGMESQLAQSISGNSHSMGKEAC
jgi:putative transposase